jgi:hypothetical protein
MDRLPRGAETSNSMAFLGMCAEKVLRLLRLFLSLFMPGFVHGNLLAGPWWRSGTFACLMQPNRRLPHNRGFELPSPLAVGLTQGGARVVFQESLVGILLRRSFRLVSCPGDLRAKSLEHLQDCVGFRRPVNGALVFF